MALPTDKVTFSQTPDEWETEAQSYVFTGLGNNSYPPGTYFPGMDEDKENFRGGMTFLYIIRYKKTPIGEYDELVYIPGSFAYGKEKQDNAMRITNIYVSDRHSFQEGRRIWGIPKHIANFEWKEIDNNTTQLTVTVTVTQGETKKEKVIFDVTLQTSKWIPAVPASSFVFPSSLLSFVQHPIALDSETEEKDKVKKFAMSWNGWVKVAYMTGQGGDGEHLPTLERMNFISAGVFANPFKMIISAPTTVVFV